jgi:hypothetical protein
MFDDVIAIPDAQMNARTKLVYLFTGREAASRNSRGVAKLPNIAIAEGTGLTEDIVSEIMQDLPAREGSPIERQVTRHPVTDENGVEQIQSVAQVAICTPERTYVSVLRAAPAMGGPSDKAQQKKAKAKARAAASLRDRIEAQAASWGRCTQHDNDLVAVKGYCPETDCGEIVGERVIRVEEFDALNPVFRDSGSRPSTVDVLVTKGPVFRDSVPTSLLDYAERVSDPVARVPRCACGCYEYALHPDGWRCLKCNVVYTGPPVRMPAAVQGGET